MLAPFSTEDLNRISPLLHRLSLEQCHWLSGFIAGRLSQIPGNAIAAADSAQRPQPSPTPKSIELAILFGTESGNAEQLAAQSARHLKKAGLKTRLLDMAEAKPQDLTAISHLLLIVSTWGEGNPPARAVEFYKSFMQDESIRLPQTRFAVCGLGDTSYEHFCQMGKDFDARLEQLGAKRLHPRLDCDVDFEKPFENWLQALTNVLLAEAVGPVSESSLQVNEAPSAAAHFAYSKANPFPATLSTRINLNGTGSDKETLHLEFSLEGSGLNYEPGDSLGVKPRNCPKVVDDLLAAARLPANASVNRPDGSAASLRENLIEAMDSTVLSFTLLQNYAKIAQNDSLNQLAQDREKARAFCRGREIADLFADYQAPAMSPQDLANLLRTLPPRLYSIASSLKACPNEAHLTVGVVRYASHGKERKGVASTFLADRVEIGEQVPVYVHANHNFRLPADPATPIIMVGPGTGIAPFRAFVQERAHTNASGDNWLFFGDRRYTYDFLYQLEWQEYLKDGVLTRLDVAFSRDAPEKIYVQHRMLQHQKDLWQWLEKGAHFYVCGDASRMAADVQQTLLTIIANEAALSTEDAQNYLETMIREKRYQRDVY